MAKIRGSLFDRIMAEEEQRREPQGSLFDRIMAEEEATPEPSPEPGFFDTRLGRALKFTFRAGVLENPAIKPVLDIAKLGFGTEAGRTVLEKVGATLDIPHRALLRAPGHVIGETIQAAVGSGVVVPPEPPKGTRANEVWQRAYGSQRTGELGGAGGVLSRAVSETAGGLPQAIDTLLDPQWKRENPKAAWVLKYPGGIALEIMGDVGLGLGLGTVGRVGAKGLALRVRGLALPKAVRKALGATAKTEDLVQYGQRWARWSIEIPHTRGLVKAAGAIKQGGPGTRLRRLFTKADEPLAESLQTPWLQGKDLSAETTFDILKEVEPSLDAIEALKLGRADRFRASMAAELIKGADGGIAVLRSELAGVLKGARDPGKVRRAAYLIRGAHDAVEKVRFAKGVPTPLLTRPISERAARLVPIGARRAGKAVARRGPRVPPARVTEEVGEQVVTPVGRFEATVQVAGEQAGRRGLQERVGEVTTELLGKQRVRRTRLEEAFSKRRVVAGALDTAIRRKEASLATRLGRTKQRIFNKEAGRYIEAPSATAADLYEKGIEQAGSLEKLISGLEKGGTELRKIKTDLFRALGKEQYSQALFEAKTISQMRQRLIRMQRASTSRAERRAAQSLEQSFADQEVRLARQTRSAAAAIPETLERSRGFQRVLRRARDLDEAFVTSPAYVARAVPSELQDAMRVIRQDRVIPLKRAHGLSAGVKERGFMDPKTGRSYSMFELGRELEKVARNPEFLKKNDYMRQLVEELNNEKTIPKLVRKLREFLAGDKAPLVARVLRADPIQSLAMAASRATQDALQTGFIRALREVGENAPDVLIRNPEWVPAKAMGEDVFKRFGDGWFFPPEAKLEMQRIIGNSAKDGAIMRTYDKFLSAWRWSVTQPWPSFHFRNNYSDFILMGHNGPFDIAGVIVDGQKAVWGKGTIDLGAKLGKMSGKDFGRLGRAYGVTFGLTRETGGGRLTRVIERASTLGMTEDVRRLGYFADRLKRGMTPMEAALDLKKVLFDYKALGDFERKTMRRILPFWSWMRNNVPLQVKTLLTKPYITNAQLRVIRSGRTEPPEWMPQWLRGATALTSSENGILKVVYGVGLPVQDLLDILDIAGNPKGALKEVLSDVERGRLRLPIVQLAVQGARTVAGLGGNLVSAPRGSENLPKSWRDFLGIREIKTKSGTRWVMTERGRRVIDQIRAVGEASKIAGAKSPGEALLRGVAGITQREFTPSELGLGKVREDLEKQKETVPFQQLRIDFLSRDVAQTPLGKRFKATQKRARVLGRRVSRERRKKEKEEEEKRR